MAAIDHLVIVAQSLEQGVQWCGDTLGVSPGPGGRHTLMATHNRLLKIAGPGWPDAYLEIIAVDPDADGPPAAGRARWFGIDEPVLQQAVEREPRLVHFVAQSGDLPRAVAALAALGEDVGQPVAASRPTPAGELRWQITVRDDGLPQHRGALPALIGWQGRHPAAAMPDAEVRLLALRVRSARRKVLSRALQAIGLDSVELPADPAEKPPLEAVLQTPRGIVTLRGGFPPADDRSGR
ncbi:VOC family protein [Piscinibacter sakaiensis]|uniref:VOC family protein n=1 Tax=Piscinibacter sakaiensis TaxID=1547922 RepID=UPI003AACEE57